MDRGLKTCPYCEAQVIEGADHCDDCGLPVSVQNLPEPAHELELALLTDRMAQFVGRRPLMVSPTIRVREVVRLLALNQIGCVVVVDKEQIVGIFTERDVLKKIGDNLPAEGDRPVADFMTRGVQTLPPTAKVAFAIQRMALGGYRHVPIVDARERPIGIFSFRDLLRYFHRKLQES